MKAKPTQVVTWGDDRGNTIDVCKACESRLTEAREWPRNGVGQEYCQVKHGLHRGECDVHAEAKGE